MFIHCLCFCNFLRVGGNPSPGIIKYWNAVINQQIIKEGKKWRLEGDASWIDGTTVMYVRDCYVQLADRLLGEATPLLPDEHSTQNPLAPLSCALILGPKGIGKTMFLNYLIVRIVEKARRADDLKSLSIVYLYQKNQTVTQEVRFTAGGCSIDGTPQEADYYLSDSIDIADGTLGHRLLLEVASENQNNYKKFTDRLTEKNGKRLTMDVWSLDELRQMKKPEWTDNEVSFLHAVFGGRIRSFLGGNLTAESAHDEIEELAEWFFGVGIKTSYLITWNRALHLIRRTITSAKGKSTKEELAIQTSLFWVVNSSTGNSGFSSTFLKLVAGRMKEKMEASLWNQLSALVGGSGEGLWFEAVGHVKLTQTDKVFTARPLKKGRKKTLEMKFNLPKVLIRSVNDIATLPTHRYGLPVFGNFMLVDAIVKPNIMLQFTVGESHGHANDIGKWGDIRQHLGGLRKNDKLIFVIPASNFGKFTCQGVPEDVECFFMTWEEVANETVTAGIKRKCS